MFLPVAQTFWPIVHFFPFRDKSSALAKSLIVNLFILDDYRKKDVKTMESITSFSRNLSP